MYKAKDLAFNIYIDTSEQPPLRCVIFSLVSGRETELGQHNIDNRMLTRCGIAPEELMENTFEIVSSSTDDEVIATLLQEGFKQNKDNE